MTYWQGVLSRLSIPGVLLLVLGGVMCFAAPWLSRRVFKRWGERAATPIKVIGLVIVILSTLILLDFIPNL
ncbi:MAG: hypothetical protein LLF96_10880 [Eubacteriales bacterium]|nr:hypothetical protein [Eubacteriales bacterium]